MKDKVKNILKYYSKHYTNKKLKKIRTKISSSNKWKKKKNLI
jgi:hypothetical protein